MSSRIAAPILIANGIEMGIDGWFYVAVGSAMLPGLVDTLTLQELASLLAFLESTTAK